MTSPLVSIVVPVFNIEKYLPACLDSLAKQTYRNLEIILVDDGSTDRSGEICDFFPQLEARRREVQKSAETSPKITVIHQKNLGLSGARNTGLKKTTGEFIAFVDGDDYLEPNYITRLVEAMDDDTDIAVCAYFEDEKTVVLPEASLLSGPDATKRLLINQENYDLVAWNKLYRTNLFREHKIEYPLGQKYEDCLTTYKLYSKAKNVAFVNQPLYHYVHRKGSITSEQKLLESLEAREQAAREAIAYFTEDENLKPSAEISLLTAKFAFLDSALRKKLPKSYLKTTIEWLKGHTEDYEDNPEMAKKLKTYLALVNTKNAIGYRAFRGIKK